ncbi:hypothetical protein REPUB_Repub18cG0028400 [Reevesia pubescens]
MCTLFIITLSSTGMEKDSIGEPPFVGGEGNHVKDRGLKQDRSTLEDVTNMIKIGSVNDQKQADMEIGNRESYRSKLLNASNPSFDDKMEDGEIGFDVYEFDDDCFLEDIEVGEFQVVDLDNGYYCFHFANEMDYNHVLMEGPWVIANHYLIVRRYNPGFRSEEATINSVAAWIRFPGIPLEYYDNEIINKIGYIIGKTLMIDRTTLVASRGRYARMCMEVDITKPLVPKIFIRGRW